MLANLEQIALAIREAEQELRQREQIKNAATEAFREADRRLDQLRVLQQAAKQLPPELVSGPRRTDPDF